MKTADRNMRIIAVLLSWCILNLVVSCGGGGGGGGAGSEEVKPSGNVIWTWVSGDSTVDRSGVYGTKGVAVATNKPGSRGGSISWTDSSGNLWLFGGGGLDNTGKLGFFNDLWSFDGTNWTWVSGDNATNQNGIYGTKGVAEGARKPGSRANSISWTDKSGNLWLFGGVGYDGAGTNGYLNDLWKYDGTNWTWVSGDSTADRNGVYGTKGVAAAANKPGSRASGISWTDSSGNLWLFGGIGYDEAGTNDDLDDLWKYDGTNWTWVSGESTVDQNGVYGTKGVAAAANKPGGREDSISWTDSSGNLWLFGGIGYDGAGANGYLNDLWKYDGTNWTWVSGDSTVDQNGVYGTKGVAAGANKPGGREGGISWTGSSGNLWLFGGVGYDGAGINGFLNDLWKYDGTSWTWVSGDSTVDHNGVYGTKGVAAAANKPGARYLSISWIDKSGNLWLFGGVGYDSAGTNEYLNDLWKISP